MDEPNETHPYPRALREDIAYLDIEKRDFQMLGSPEALAKLFGALAAATSEFTPIHKNRQVTIKSEKGSYSFVYAELSESIDATRPALAKNGLAVVQPYTKLGDVAILRTVLSHSGGGLMVLACEIPRAQNIKDLGGSLTYLRRYTYNALLCLAADEDLDDQPEAARGETGAQSGPRRTPEVPAQARQQAKPAEQKPANGPGANPTQARPQGGATAPKAESQTKAATTTPQPTPASASEAPTSAGSLTGADSTKSAAGLQTPQTSAQPSSASPASATPTTQSPAVASSQPSSASASGSAGPDNGSPATEEQKLQMHAILEAMRIGRPARNGYVSDLMQSIGVSGKLTMVSAARVLTELEARKTAFLSSPGL